MDDQQFDDGFLEDDEFEEDEPRKKRVSTGTKVLLVLGAWVLLTMVLVGQFSKKSSTVVARLDNSSLGADADGDGEISAEEADLEVVDSPELEPFDLNEDGYLDAEERTAGGATLAALHPQEVASGGSAAGSGGGTYDGSSGDASATQTTPGAAPTGSTGDTTGGRTSGATSGGGTTGGGTTATTATTTTGGGGGGGGGGGATTTTTAKPASPTTTTKPTTSTAPPTTSPPTTAGGGGGQAAAPVTITVTAKNDTYGYPEGSTRDLVLPAGSKIRFDNVETNNSDKHSFTITAGWDSGLVKRDDPVKESPALTSGLYTFKCSVHATMNGTLRIT